MINLGLSSQELYPDSKCCAPCACDTDKEIHYPTIYLDGAHAKLMGLGALQVGKEYEVTMRVKATRISRNSRETESGKEDTVDGTLAIVAMDNWESDEDEAPADSTARATARVMTNVQ